MIVINGGCYDLIAILFFLGNPNGLSDMCSQEPQEILAVFSQRPVTELAPGLSSEELDAFYVAFLSFFEL